MLEGPQASPICPSVKGSFQDEYGALTRRIILTGQNRNRPARSSKLSTKLWLLPYGQHNPCRL
jgi:hypothetical protein